jgi:N-acetylneuraminate synthase
LTAPRTYVIAEAGVNHDGSIEDALRLVDVAADAGADCIKFQTFRAETLAAPRAEKATYQKQATGAGESQRAMLARLELSHDAHIGVQQRARARSVDFLSTPFDPASLSFLVGELGLSRIKVGSGDLTNAPLLLEIAKGQRDVILSTGMATLGEVEEALSVLAFGFTRAVEAPSRAAFAAAWADRVSREALKSRVVLLHCTTEYPAPAESVNLRAMDTLACAFDLPVGYSDHTLGIEASLAAVARGAVMIEKHLTLDRTRPGPDHAASLDPRQFAALVEGIRLVEQSLGDGRKLPQPVEAKNISIARKALVAAKPIAAGEKFSIANLAAKRPGQGLAPIALWDLIGRTAHRSYAVDEAIES